jgi:hypothetical protein
MDFLLLHLSIDRHALAVLFERVLGNLYEYGLYPEDVGLSPRRYCQDCLEKHTLTVFFDEREGEVVLVALATNIATNAAGGVCWKEAPAQAFEVSRCLAASLVP